MTIFKTLLRIPLKSFWQGLVLVLKHPHFVYPTIGATRSCMQISTQYYGNEHHRNTPANAFRHAFWNYSIALRCGSFSTNRSKLLLWTKAITDWHEVAFINSPLAREMDLHNNAVGRHLFSQHEDPSIALGIQEIRKMATMSSKATNIAAIAKHKNSLVHLCDFSD